MKHPKTPPRVLDNSDTVSKMFSRPAVQAEAFKPFDDKKYYHWDKLRFMEPPEGLSHEEWWFTIKWRRVIGRKSLLLKSNEGQFFSFIITEKMQEQLHNLSMGLGGQIATESPVLSEAGRDQFITSSLVEEAITSSQLEGAVTTRKVAESMLKSGRKPNNVSEQMIVNNYNAMRRIRELKGAALSKELILELHTIVTKGTLADPSASGRLRNASENDIAVVDSTTNEVLHQPPPADELGLRIDQLCKFANNKDSNGFVNPRLRAIAIHFWLAYVHPFVDGNGRTARTLFYWSMLNEGFWLAEYISISSIILKGPAKYAKAFLHSETDDCDLTYFLHFHLGVIERAVKQLNDHIRAKVKESKQLLPETEISNSLNDRQRALIIHALKNPEHQYTVNSHKNSNAIATQTARTDLLDLTERGLLIQSKRGNQFIFTPAPNLRELLA